jgi:hypothetical protein
MVELELLHHLSQHKTKPSRFLLLEHLAGQATHLQVG